VNGQRMHTVTLTAPEIALMIDALAAFVGEPSDMDAAVNLIDYLTNGLDS
jgi:hypothetical protein